MFVILFFLYSGRGAQLPMPFLIFTLHTTTCYSVSIYEIGRMTPLYIFKAIGKNPTCLSWAESSVKMMSDGQEWRKSKRGRGAGEGRNNWRVPCGRRFFRVPWNEWRTSMWSGFINLAGWAVLRESDCLVGICHDISGTRLRAIKLF